MIYTAKLKARKEMERTIQRGLLGWWHDVCPGQTLELREATHEDIARCSLKESSSRDPADYLCENFDRGSLVLREAIAVLTPWTDEQMDCEVRKAIQRLGAERFIRALGGEMHAAPVPVKDHVVRETVNAVTRAARECCLSEGVIAEQLRGRIADAMLPLIQAARGVPTSQTPSLTLDAGEARYLAARLRRLFQHFGTPVPGMEDDARLIGNAGAGIGLLLTGRTDGVLASNTALRPAVDCAACGLMATPGGPCHRKRGHERPAGCVANGVDSPDGGQQ